MRTQRDEILRVIRDSCRHMPADEIYLLCRSSGLNISMATVYRNLGIMVDAKILRRVSAPGRPDYFDITVAEHAHKVCEVCGEMTDIEVGDLRSHIERLSGIAIVDYELCVRYVCETCAAKAKEEERPF